MFRAILFTQWKWSRGLLALAAVALFSIPLMSIRGGAFLFEELDARNVLLQMQSYGTFYAFGALALGLVAGLTAWSADHASRHVYALSLPVKRWRYTLLRFGAGATTLIGPVVALWLGAMVAVNTASIPLGLQGYPTALAFRFALGVLLAYSLCFAAGSTSPRIAGYVLTAIATVVAINVAIVTFTSHAGVLDPVLSVLFDRHGMLHVFAGRWMLIDV
jgi:hypothetical protein